MPGITRKSVIEMARSKGFEVEERDVSVDEVLDRDECFCTGTAVVVVPVGTVTFRGQAPRSRTSGSRPWAESSTTELTGLQSGKIEDKLGWLEEVPEGYHLD